MALPARGATTFLPQKPIWTDYYVIFALCYYTFGIVVSTIFLLVVSYHKKLLILSGVIPDVPFFEA